MIGTAARYVAMSEAMRHVAGYCIVNDVSEREFQIDLITTAPGVRYRVTTSDGEAVEVDNPTRWPNPAEIGQIEEPIIEATVITREEYLGEILKLLEEKRGEQKKFEYIGTGRVLLVYALPLNEIVLDFYDRLKTVSRGYASLDYHLAGYRVSPMVKLDVLVAGDPVEQRVYAHLGGLRPTFVEFDRMIEETRPDVVLVTTTDGDGEVTVTVKDTGIGISAANAIAKRILSGTPNAAQDHINFLKAGSSKSPMEVFKIAGVDMTSTQPIEDAFEVLAEYSDRLGTLTK